MTISTFYRPNLQPLHYTRGLFSALQHRAWIYDVQDLAHISDDEAWDKIRRDSTLESAMENRRWATSGLITTVHAVSDEPQDKLVAGVLQDMVRECRHLLRAKYNLTEASFRGSSWAVIVGGRRKWTPPGQPSAQTYWLPARLHHVDRWRLRLKRRDESPNEGMRIGWEMFSVSRDRWEQLPNTKNMVKHFYQRTESDLGYGRGLLQSLFPFWRAKEIAISQGLMAVERWAQGLVTVKLDGYRAGSPDTATSNEEIRDAYLAQLAKTRGEHFFAYGAEDQLEVHWPSGSGHGMVMDFIRYLDTQMLRLIQQGDLTTGQGDSDTGSYAQAKEQGEKGDDMFAANRALLAEDLTYDWLHRIYDLNRGALTAICKAQGLPIGRCGRIGLGADATIDVDTQLAIVQAGVKIKESDFYERIGHEAPEEGDKVVELDPPGGGEEGGGFGMFNANPGWVPAQYGADALPGGEMKPDLRGLAAQYGEGEPCKVGEAAARTGCVPAGGEGPTKNFQERQKLIAGVEKLAAAGGGKIGAGDQAKAQQFLIDSGYFPKDEAKAIVSELGGPKGAAATAALGVGKVLGAAWGVINGLPKIAGAVASEATEGLLAQKAGLDPEKAKAAVGVAAKVAGVIDWLPVGPVGSGALLLGGMALSPGAPKRAISKAIEGARARKAERAAKQDEEIQQ